MHIMPTVHSNATNPCWRLHAQKLYEYVVYRIEINSRNNGWIQRKQWQS